MIKDAKKIYYITRSYPNVLDSGGGAQMRAATVELLRSKGLDVWIISPNYGKETVVNKTDKHILIALNHHLKTYGHLEAIGLIEDYLDPWVKRAFSYLKDIITKDDIVLATSGGELGTIKLASKLKAETKCKYIANFRDPLMFTHVLGKKIYHPAVRFRFANRDRLETKYLKNADHIVTSSNTYLKDLKIKHPKWEKKLSNIHFGFIKSIKNNPSNKTENNKITTIVYGGNMGPTQSPEILATAVDGMQDVVAQFIGDYSKNKHLSSKTSNIKLSKSLPYDQYNKLVTEVADIGFTSLTGVFSQACVPSKIYEYINLGLPILGVFEDGDAKDIINKNGYGIACSHNLNEIKETIEKMQSLAFRKRCKENLLKDKDKWAMSYKIEDLIALIKQL